MISSYRFGEFQLDPAIRELRHRGRVVTLPPKAFDCIVYLIERRERAVGRDELIAAVWGHPNLSDSLVGQTILMARRAVEDTGEEQHVIKTVRGFGYRWGTPVDVETSEPVEDGATHHAATPEAPRRKPIWLWLLLAVLCAGVVIAIALRSRHAAEVGVVPENPPVPRAEGEIALLLPVAVDSAADDAWIRLGVMELVANRLREAGQPMVPSDTVIALLRGQSTEPDAKQLGQMTDATGAGLVLSAQARFIDGRWIVSLYSLAGAEPPLTALGDAPDVLEAARAAADRMAVMIGLTPGAVPEEAEPGLRMLVQRIDAALLAAQTDTARKLIEQSDARLRESPEVRFQWARIELNAGHVDAARSAFESLLEEVPAQRDPVLRARTLNGLGVVHNGLDDPAAAEPLLQEAAHLLRESGPTPDYLDTVIMNLGITADKLGNVDAARAHYAQARRLYEGVGDVRGIAYVDMNLGVLEGRRERYAKARRYFESAAKLRAVTQDVGGELYARANMIEADLGLLRPQAAMAGEARVKELLERTTNAGLIAHVNFNRAALFDVVGEARAAESLLSEVLAATEGDDDLHWLRMQVLLSRAEHAMEEAGDTARAASLASEVVEGLARYPFGHEPRGRAWLLLVRAHLALGDRAAAIDAYDAFKDWSALGKSRAAHIYASLAEAELAVADGRDEVAVTAFERALALAEDGHVPRQVLLVARSYVPWLLGNGSSDQGRLERALSVVNLLDGYTDQSYDAALLRLRVYRAMGPASAWRTALESARSLAGERQIPEELQELPADQGRLTSS